MPTAPFAPGEQVTVQTGLDVHGGSNGDFSFTVAERPPPGRGNESGIVLPTLPPAKVDRFRSRPGLQAPVVTIDKRSRRTARGLILLAPSRRRGARSPTGR